MSTATREGFTDGKGQTMTWDEGVKAAARCIMDQHETDFVRGLIDACLAPDEVLVWIVYPDTDEFAR